MTFKFKQIKDWYEFYAMSDVCPTARYFKVEENVLIPTAIIILPNEHVNDSRFVSEFLYVLASNFESMAEEEEQTNLNEQKS